MIAPGSLAIYAARRAVKRRTVSYVPARRRVSERRARGERVRAPADVVFGRHDYEFPTATLVSKRPGRAELVGGLRAWLAARWRWVSPRSIPLTVALISMLAALGATSYLSDLAHTSRVEAPPPMHGAHVHIVHTASAGTMVVIDVPRGGSEP